MNKIRVYELAKELGIQSKELIAAAKELNIKVNNHMSTLEDSQVTAIKNHMKKPVQSQQPKKKPLTEQKPVRIVRIPLHS